jgi:hypothetical protein
MLPYGADVIRSRSTGPQAATRLACVAAFVALLTGIAPAARAATVGWWRFEGTGAAFTADSGPNALVLTNAGAVPVAQPGFDNPLPQTGQSNETAAALDGTDRFTADPGAAAAAARFTAEAYVRLDALPSATQFLAGIFRSDNANRRWALVVVSGGGLSLYLSSNGVANETVSSGLSLTSNRNYYVAAAVDAAETGSAGITFYLRDLTATGTPFSIARRSHTTTNLFAAAAPFSIGGTPNATSPLFGVIDEVRLSDDVLDAGDLLASEPGNPPLPEPVPLPEGDGYRGIWYMNQPTGDAYVYKYSGGMATYPQQLAPMAVYSPAAHKTFFVYGGTDASNSTLHHMVSWYDHATRRVARPRRLLDKATTDAHDNPVLGLDDDNRLWIFSNTHGETRRSYLHRAVAPLDVGTFEEVPLPSAVFPQSRFSYGQPRWVPGHGFLFLHTRYTGGTDRDLFTTTSADGTTWTARRALSQMLSGQYQISGRHGTTVATAFNVHPTSGGLNARTDLFYLQSADMGASWTTAAGVPVDTPLTNVANPALVHDYMAEGLLVYLKDLAFDAGGRPVILYLTCTDYRPGPAGDPRTLRTARWDGAAWIIRDVVATDHNYDYGSLSIDSDGTWRIVGTFLPGPQVYGTGGEVGIWTSADQGASWQLVRALTSGSLRNHNYPRRPVDAHDDFFAMWADGDAFAPSASSLYFTDRHGDAVYRLPGVMTNESAYPEVVAVADPGGDPDGDGVPTGEELRAGTHPRRADSALRMASPGAPPPAANTVAFSTATAMQYRVEMSTNLVLGEWHELPGLVEGTGESVLVTNPATPGSVPIFHRVRLVEP